MAKIRKKYNKAKHFTQFAEHHMRDIVIGYLDRWEGCHFIDVKHEQIVKPNDLLASCANMPHKWAAYLAVFGRTQLGEEYMKSVEVTTPSRFYQKDLAPVLEAHHLELMKQVPDHHRCGVAWIASPTGKTFSEKEAGELFTKMGAWE